MNKKTDNSHMRHKLLLRRSFLDMLPDGTMSVFDACQGSGKIWRRLLQEYPCNYWGTDVKRKPGRLKIDSARVLAQAGWDFDVVDIDTYGSPWKHYMALLPNVAKPVTVFLTVGIVRMMSGGNIGKEALNALGIRFSRRVPTALTARLFDISIIRCLGACHAHNLDPVRAAMITANRMRYIAIHLEPRGR